ncbi:MAG: universal stress protein [Thermomicrobiales bacterium]|nr:universal stress protein [Thermomicrobiales bacterium]
MYDRIVVPLDGSTMAETALPGAVAQARVSAAPVHLLRVIPVYGNEPTGARITRTLQSPNVSWLLEAQVTDVRAYLGDLAEVLLLQGVAVTTDIRCGLPDEELIRALQPGDLVVATFRSPSRWSRFLKRDLATDIIRRTSASLLWIRHSPVQTGGRKRERPAGAWRWTLASLPKAPVQPVPAS